MLKKGWGSCLIRANRILRFRSGYATQGSPGSNANEAKDHYDVKEPLYIMPLFVDYSLS
jgi:hypothetical protein